MSGILEQAESVTHANIVLIGLFIFSQSPEADITSVRRQFVELSYANSVAMKNRPEGRFFVLRYSSHPALYDPLGRFVYVKATYKF